MRNPFLFQRLTHYFGAGQVRVLQEDQPAVTRMVQRHSVGEKGARSRFYLETIDAGEEFAVCCNWCGDSRYRLRINHRWGTLNELGQEERNLVHCFNEDCYSSPGRLFDFFQAIFGPPNRHRPLELPRGLPADAAPPAPIELPSRRIPLAQLVVNEPQHRAVRYLRQRGFDPAWIGKHYGVSYCPDSRAHWPWEDRLIIPLYHEAKLAGWQAREIGEGQEGSPKYWTARGTRRGQVLYNSARAVCYRTVVLVEGTTDVWRFGDPALAVLGKTLSTAQLRWLYNHFRGASVVVLLDPTQDEQSRLCGEEHHLERARWQLEEPFRGRVLPVYLPENTDPGSLPRETLREIVQREAEKAKIPVSFQLVAQQVAAV